MADRLINEEYLVKEYERLFTRNVRHIMDDLGARRAANKKYSDRYWKRDKHLWIVSDHKDGQKRNEVTFYGKHYSSDSEIVYGDPVTIVEDTVKVDGFSKLLDRSKSPVDTKETIRHLVRLSRNITDTLRTKMETSVDSETEFEGSFPGGSIKEAIKLHFGFEIEDTHSESETQDEEEELIEEIPVPAGTKLLVTLEKNKLITETPFEVNGYLDMGFTLNFENWATSKHKQGHILFGTHKHSNHFKFDNLKHFEQWLHGYDVAFRGMEKYEPSSRAQKAMDEIFSLENRLVQSEGVRRKVFENNVTSSVSEVKQ